MARPSRKTLVIATIASGLVSIVSAFSVIQSATVTLASAHSLPVPTPLIDATQTPVYTTSISQYVTPLDITMLILGTILVSIILLVYIGHKTNE